MAQTEPFKPGHYTALQTMNIRAAMNTMTDANLVGRYSNGEPFSVYEVYPETGGIVWGRVSSNTGGGTSKYVALRVNNHPKVMFEKPFAQEQLPTTSLLNWATGIDAWARVQGYKGPKPE